MNKNILLIALAISTLTGCASGVSLTEIKKPKLMVPASLTQACAVLPQPADGSRGELLNNHVQVAEAYHQCKQRHQALVEWTEKTIE